MLCILTTDMNFWFFLHSLSGRRKCLSCGGQMRPKMYWTQFDM